MNNARPDNRSASELRTVDVHKNFIQHAEGSVLFCMGGTKVLCNTTIEDGVPRWMEAEGHLGGWITAEYAMLPRSTHTRTSRETSGLRGRTHEIKRLIGRSLRGAVCLEKLGPRTCTIDCDVLQADGGTRTAAITGGYISLALALNNLIRSGQLPDDVLQTQVAAVSVGIVNGAPLLDLCYAEDSRADVDANVVMTGEGHYVEIQGTAEGMPLSRQALDELLELAADGVKQLMEYQRAALSED